MLRERPPFEIMEQAPGWAKGYLQSHDKFTRFWNSWGKVYENLYGKPYLEALEACRARINEVEVDRTKVKPMVKITGEFWASITEGDGNFNMFRFLEREGAQVIVEPVATWVAYLLCQAKARALNNKEVKAHHEQLAWYDVKRRFKREMAYQAKILGLHRRRDDVGALLSSRWREAGRAGSPASGPKRTGAAGRALLSPLCARRRGTSGSRQERVLHGAPQMPHGAGVETVRLHAVFAIGRRSIGGNQ